jgi:hypothetical protein
MLRTARFALKTSSPSTRVVSVVFDGSKTGAKSMRFTHSPVLAALRTFVVTFAPDARHSYVSPLALESADVSWDLDTGNLVGSCTLAVFRVVTSC